MKKNYPLFTRVKFVKALELTDKTGTILGRYAIDVYDHYIVLLDVNEKLQNDIDVAAIVITEHCLEQISDCVVFDIELLG